MAIQPIQSQINIGGRLLSTMPAAVKGAQLQLLALRSSAIRANSTLMGLGKGLLGFGASFLAFEGVKSFIKESIDLAKEEKGVHAALLLTITNQNKARGMGAEQAKALGKEQVEAIERTSKALQEQSGFSKEIFNVYAKTLNMYRLTPKAIQQVMPALADLVAYQKKAGMNVTANADAFGKAMLGFPKALKAIGIEWNKIQLANFMRLDDIHKFQALIAGMENAYGGAATSQDPLVKAANLAKIHWEDTKRAIGENWIPVQRKLTVFFGSIADMISPSLIKLSQFISDNADSWISIIKTSVLPMIQKLTKDGLNLLTRGIAYFKENSTWLLPWIGEAVRAIAIWTFVIGPLIAVIKDLGSVLALVTAANPWMLLATAAAIGATYVITHWEQVKKWFVDFYEWMAGTEWVNPHNQEARQMKWFPQGTVPRAEPAQLGWVENIKNWFSKEFPVLWKQAGDVTNQFFLVTLAGWSKSIDAWEDDQFPKWGAAIATWFKDVWTGLVTWLIPNVWGAMIAGVKGVGNAVNEFLIHPITTIKELWDKFLKSLNPPSKWNWNPPFVPNYLTGPGKAIPGTINGPSQTWNGLFKSGWYGSAFGEHQRDANWGPLGRLGKGGIAVSKDSGFRLGEYVDVIDPETGRVIRRNELVNDWSYHAPHKPNHHTFELNNDRILQERAILRRSLIQAPLPKDQSSRRDIHLHYQTGDIHIHGTEDLNSRFAEHHRRAVDKFKSMLSEAIQQNHRAMFA
jgi:hypothetical protein